MLMILPVIAIGAYGKSTRIRGGWAPGAAVCMVLASTTRQPSVVSWPTYCEQVTFASLRRTQTFVCPGTGLAAVYTHTHSPCNGCKVFPCSHSFKEGNPDEMGHGAEMNGCGKFLKYLMFTVNFLALVGGIVVMAVGIWTCVDHAYMEQLLGTNLYMSAAYILIVTGVVVVLVSFFGCMGAVKEIKCMLLTYFIVMFGIFVTMLVGGILGYAFRSTVSLSMRTRMYSSLNDYGRDRLVTDAWDFTQSTLRCCGVEGFDGYKVWVMENRNFNSQSQVPLTCCQKILGTSAGLNSYNMQNQYNNYNSNGPLAGESYMQCQRSPNSNTAYLTGCLDRAVEAVNNQAAILGGVGIGIAFVMLLGMIFSMALFKMIK